MAIYRFSAQVISRSAGRSVTAAAAYRAGVLIEDRRTGQVHDYNRRSGVVHAEILAPENTPAWMTDRKALWNAVEIAEKRKDAQLSREVQLALPHELDASQRLSLVRNYVRMAFVAKGMIADVAIHTPHRKGDDRNHHAHVMLTMREIVGDGFGKKERGWNETALIEHWRETWQDAVNRALERAGHAGRVDHRSLEEQRVEAQEKAEQARAANDNAKALVFDLAAARLDRDPEPKIGAIALALERRGEQSERGNLWREVVARNVDRFRVWIAAQRSRLDSLWERMEAALSQQRERLDSTIKEATDQTQKGHEFTQEQRDQLLGRHRYGASPKERDKDDKRER
ncbi:MobA/MobL family protein [Rhizobium sp. NTR19]|uniref:MobA/MobL family protein n=1 Tax=Neorhizobium turbinariae TaxID=2937795 RepID=A0ABT0IXX1_9HYPH|nr:MobQ family relaxase [Neorhizobium turbinariae]MCK8782723.1 MobA/MobL family protein [Neorhizobium turbinariae]